MKEPWERPETQPEHVAVILREWMHKFRLDVGWKQYRAFRIWEETIDDTTRKHTKPESFRRGVLKVLVDSQACYFELVNFRKKDLLSKMQEQDSKVCIKNLFFVSTGMAFSENSAKMGD